MINSTISPTSTLSRLFAILFVAGLIASLAMLVRPDIHLLSRPFIEDAFYSLSVARTLGQGGGISIDGVTPTNGVQPLICFIDAPAFALAGDDPYTALRIVLGLQVVLAGLAALSVAWLAASLVRSGGEAGIGWSTTRREIFWLVAGTIASSYSLLVHLQNGLETSLAAAFVFASMAMYIERIARCPDAPIADFARLGALLGLGVLARIDIALLVAAISGWHLIVARGPGRRTSAFAGAATIGLMSLLVSLPWWLYNAFEFGHLMPTSGLAQQDLLTERIRSLDLVVRGLSNSVMLVLHAPGEVDGVIAYIGLLVLAGVALLVGSIPSARRWLLESIRSLGASIDLWSAAPLAIFLATLVIYYTLFFGAPHFIPRYLVSLWLCVTIAVLLTLHALWRSAPAGGIRRRLLATGAIAAIVATTWAQSRQFSREGIYTNVMLHAAEWIAANTVETDRVGMFQSGTTGFLFRRVTNLDGKVNARALAALRSGDLPRFVDSASFDYIIDLDFYTRHIFRDPHLRARYTPIDTLPRDFIVWRLNR